MTENIKNEQTAPPHMEASSPPPPPEMPDGVMRYDDGGRVRTMGAPPSPVPVEPSAAEQAVTAEFGARIEQIRRPGGGG